MSILEITTTIPAVIDTATAFGFQTPQVEWSIPDGLQSASRQLAFFLALLWVVWVLAQFAIPKKRQMMAGGGMGAGRFVAAAVLVVILLDLSLIPTIINWILEGIWWIAGLFGIV